ncbi:aminotransferase class III-fold pyridoxal phosphate-dependent enzyme [Streptomyces atratus]|uniref:Aspartate aminotransferase family protein n=1 Tax=Streptomyces atratus TaxID=1893 RepID=A0A2Z5JC81_STRAR|nr:aminotransferase class III-fold pyridoxal phosphate-dependent enzyme [Streptomyces atratus]AXE77978.1 aspartate aminotransferase family protein [Streptomyces atratus]WPW28936.1 aminotransferase class III-fold pyridoxal phosphate-dependent enzyme [Streptomyces atratus]
MTTTHTGTAPAPATDPYADLGTRYRRYLSKGRASLGEMFGGDVEVAAEGPWIHTASGSRILNCGGYGVFLMGARHPRVVAEVTRQLNTNPVATRLLLEPAVVDAAEALIDVVPAGLQKVHFAGSGAEAVEGAIKLARAQGRRRLISMDLGYHGKTMGALSLTAKDVFQEPFRPLLPQVSHVPYGDAAALEAELARYPGEGCVIVEPVQGEAGVIVPPEGYLRDVARLCREYGALFVLDEIQTGLGRLGTWWGADREGVVPDILLVGKGLAGGVVPVSALVATPEAFRPFDKDPFIHTSTFSGNPLAMAAARGALAAIKEDSLVERSDELGRLLLTELDRIARKVLGHRLLEVRGAGLLIGLEFTVPGLAGDLLLELIGAGVLANHSLNSSTVMRLTPPAVLGPDDVQFLLDAFEKAALAVLA